MLINQTDDFILCYVILNFENVTIYSKTGNHLGGLASTASNVTLKNITFKSGTVNNDGKLVNDIASTGGFLGSTDNTTIIEDCYTNLNVTASKNAGGLIGLNMNSKIKNSFSSGSVNASSTFGGFIGLQAITDKTYNTPENVYYNKNETGDIKAVGGYVNGFHDLTVLDSNSLSIGIRSISTPKELILSEYSNINFSVTINPEATLSYTVNIENPNVAKYENNKIIASSPGSSKIHTNIKIGNHYMLLTTDLIVNKHNGVITEKEVLEFLGLTKKENYVTGFLLGTDIKDIQKKLSLNDSITLKNIKNSNNIEIYNGIISTGMTISLNFNNTDYTYIVVIKGDCNGDGKIYATDYVKVKNHIMGKSKLSGAYLEAADINNDGNIYATDYVLIKNHIMGKKPIIQTIPYIISFGI